MSQRHLLRVLLAASALAGPGAAYAQCTKDTECKGDRVCDRGNCVSPSERAQPPPPPTQPEYVAPPPARPAPRPVAPPAGSAWDASAKKNVITYDLLATAAGIGVAADLANNGYAGLTILQVAFAYERAIMPRFSVYGIVSPSHWEQPGFNPVNYLGLTVGAKYYFFGEAPAGLFAGGQVGLTPLNLGPGIEPEVGYWWPFDFGLILGAVLGVQFSVPESSGILYIRPALEGHIGWNF